MDLGLLALLTLLIGGGAGFAVGRATNSARRQSQALAEEVQRVREEMVDYRAHVTDHFNTTAKLVNEMTMSYMAVYKHLAEGAQQLSTGDLPRMGMEMPTDRLLADGNVAQVEQATRVRPPITSLEAEDAETAGKAAGLERAARAAGETVAGEDSEPGDAHKAA